MAEENLGFENLDISPDILRGLEELGFESMTPIQEQAIPVLLEGRDVIGQAQTGTGKTAAFGVPILQKIDPENKNIQAIILCPTRELAMQAADDIRNFAKYMHGVKVLPVYGGQDILRQIRGLKGTQIVVGTPGRVMDHMRRHTIRLNDVSMVVLDEADEMLDMGFREDMETILGEIEAEHQTCLFSATMAPEILKLTKQFQNDPVHIKIASKELTVESIKQYMYGVKSEYKMLALSRLLSFYRYKKCIIFCNTKSMVDELTQKLNREGYEAGGLHGDLNQKQRDFVMGRFRSGQLNILIATDIAARGIDVSDVEAVINYDIPQEIEYYVHRIGRTGRAGKEGVSHSLCRSQDFRRIHEIEHTIHAEMEERKIPTIDEIKAAQEKATLDKVMETLNDGHSGGLIPMVKEYCDANGVSLEAFAAAAVKMQMPDLPEDVAVDLPAQKRGRGSMSRRNDSRHGTGRHDGSGRSRYGGDRRGHSDGRRSEGRRSDGRRSEDRHDHRRRNERGDRPVDKKDVKRVRLNGEAYVRKPRRRF